MKRQRKSPDEVKRHEPLQLVYELSFSPCESSRKSLRQWHAPPPHQLFLLRGQLEVVSRALIEGDDLPEVLPPALIEGANCFLVWNT